VKTSLLFSSQSTKAELTVFLAFPTGKIVGSQASFRITGWRMKIVVADPIFLTEEYKKRLEALGELEIHKNVPLSHDEFTERIKDDEVGIV